MKSDNVKDREKPAKAGVQEASTADDLEPCTAPQAVEALRFDTPDEACDDGVN